MTFSLRQIAGTPLVQFLAIGAVVTAIHAALAPDGSPTESAPQTIVIGAERLAQLEAQFERTWRRPPTPAEREGIVKAFVREEILYREGLSLSLGEEDPIIRRRIAQKMEFLLEPGPGEIELDDAMLAEHLEANRERFREPGKVALHQILIDPGQGGEGLDAAVAALLASLDEGAAPEDLGKPTLLPTALRPAPIRDVARVFGGDFAMALDSLPVGQWVGPVTSSFGPHLVRIDERTEPRDPPLADVREAVSRDLEATRRDALKSERFEALRSRYEVIAETPSDLNDAAAEVSVQERTP